VLVSGHACGCVLTFAATKRPRHSHLSGVSKQTLIHASTRTPIHDVAPQPVVRVHACACVCVDVLLQPGDHATLISGHYSDDPKTLSPKSTLCICFHGTHCMTRRSRFCVRTHVYECACDRRPGHAHLWSLRRCNLEAVTRSCPCISIARTA
jgi:hypothetical protein